ncbi:MAG: hypothetical protein MR681_09225 [Prevotella sp.]|nr:hypothetical protein [Prevotella sp.]
MKKVFMMGLAALAITFASCDNKANKEAMETATDSVATVDNTVDAQSAADEVISALTSNMEKKDASAFQTTLESVKTKVTEFLAKNPEAAKDYLSKVQTFLKDNASKIKDAVGDNATITTAINAIANIPADKYVDGLKGAVDAAKNAGIDTKGAVESTVKNAKDKITDKAAEVANDTKDKANETIDKAASDAKGKLGL